MTIKQVYKEFADAIGIDDLNDKQKKFIERIVTNYSCDLGWDKEVGLGFLAEEIAWCEKNKEMVGKEYYNGFKNGLLQAQMIITSKPKETWDKWHADLNVRVLK